MQAIRFMLIAIGLGIFFFGLYWVAIGVGAPVPRLGLRMLGIGFEADGLTSGAIIALLGLGLIFIAAQFMKKQVVTRTIKGSSQIPVAVPSGPWIPQTGPTGDIDIVEIDIKEEGDRTPYQ
jgi:hypothetical protein